MTNYDIRRLAKHISKQLIGRYALFLTPILLTNLTLATVLHQSLFLTPVQRLQLSSALLPKLLEILTLFFTSSASLVLLAVVRRQREAVRFSDSTLIFQKAVFIPFLRVLMARWIYLLPWSIALQLLILYLNTFQNDLNNPNALLAVLGIVVVGLVKAYQNYTYSMSVFLLFEQVASGQPIKAFDIVKASKVIMKGHVWRYIRLDWSFLGWHLLTGLTFGLAGFYTLPYRTSADVIFYQNLIQRYKALEDKQAD